MAQEENIGTWMLIIINLLAYTFVALHGKPTDPEVILKYGGKWAPAIFQGAWWRFFTAPVLHFGLLHLGMNLYALFALGPQIEYLFGRQKLLTIYLFSALWGVLGSLYFSPQSLSVGASGAIFGLVGALLCFTLTNRHRLRPDALPNLLMVIGVNLALGILIPGIDNFAHLGGLLAGFLVAFLLGFNPNRRKLALFSFAVLTALLIGLSSFPATDSWRGQLARGGEALAKQDYAGAIVHLEAAKTGAPSQVRKLLQLQLAEAHFYRGNETLDADPKLAETQYQKSLSYQEDAATYHNLILALLAQNKTEEAQAVLEDALIHYPGDENLLKLEQEFERRK